MRYAAVDALRDLLVREHDTSSLRPGEFWALDDVSFDLAPEESLAIMGLNGAGKTTLLRLLLGSLRLTAGRVESSGRVALLSEHGLGFDPVLSGRENAYMSAAVLGIERDRLDRSFDEMVAFAGLEEFIDSPVRFYSSGMRARLGFSVAMQLSPDALLVDEVLAVGDIGFQRRCIEHAKRYLGNGGALLLVSHNPHLVQALCERCIVLDHGRVVYDGDAVGGAARYLEAVQASPDDPLALDAAVEGLPEKGTALSIEAEPIPNRPSAGLGEVVAIESLVIESPEGGGPRSDAPARVRLRYRASRDVEVRWGVSFHTPDLETTIACDGPLEPLVLERGRGELVGDLDRLPLTGGAYALRAAVMDPHTELPFALLGFEDEPHRFDVEMSTSRRNNFRMYTHDLIALDGLRWSLRRDERAEDPAVDPVRRAARKLGGPSALLLACLLAACGTPGDEPASTIPASTLEAYDSYPPETLPGEPSGAWGFSHYVFSRLDGEITTTLVEGPREGQVRCQDADLPCSYLDLKALRDSADPIPDELRMTRRELEALVAELETVSDHLLGYGSLDEACADGYQREGTQNRNMGIHMMNDAYRVDGLFDLEKPEMLLFAMEGGEELTKQELGDCVEGRWTGDPSMEIVGAAYILPIDQFGENHVAGFAGPLDNWHTHYHTCRGENATAILSREACEERGGTYIEKYGWMIHVYPVPDFDNQDGVFAMWNSSVWPKRHRGELARQAADVVGRVSTIFDFEFESLEISAGETVTFRNADHFFHTVSAGTYQSPSDEFDSGDLYADETYSVTFEQPGTYDVFCRHHPFMSGRIVVRAEP